MNSEEDLNSYENPYAAPQFPNIQDHSVAEQDLVASELNPFLSIWLRPRDTVRWVLAVNPKLHVVLLVCLAGISSTLDRASSRNTGDTMPTSAIIISACLLGPLGGLFGLWLSSHLIRLTGSWIGGKGLREHIKTAIAWASVPSVVALPLWVLQIVFFGSDMFTTATPRIDAEPILLYLFFGFAAAQFILGLWGFVLLCHTIAEAQRYRTAWLGLGNLLLAGAVIFIPLIVIGLLLVLMSLS